MVSIAIQCDPQTQQVRLSGPLGNKELCLRVLEMARQAVIQHAPQDQGSITIPGPEQTKQILRAR